MASVRHGLQLVGVGDLVAGLVLGQDLHERPQLQPPLLFGDPVPVGQEEATVRTASSRRTGFVHSGADGGSSSFRKLLETILCVSRNPALFLKGLCFLDRENGFMPIPPAAASFRPVPHSCPGTEV